MANTSLRYIDIDSTYRDRKQFPLPSEFCIRVSFGRACNAFSAVDPIINSYPYETSTTQAGSSTTNIILNASASSIDNYYINSILEIAGEFTTITAYNGSTKAATVSPALSIAPLAGTTYTLRRGTPVETGNIVSATLDTVTLPVTSSSTENYYKYMYIYFPSLSILKSILSYDGATRVITINGTFGSTIPPNGTAYEILQFSRDNYNTLNFTGSTVATQQAICYEMQLINLIIPNKLLYTANGGIPLNYPYLYVGLSPESSPIRGVLWSNNPNAMTALFKVPIDDYNLIKPFLILSSSNMAQTVKFKINDTLKFSVYLPNGELLQYTPDTVSPLPPNPMLQISCVISIKML
jgi:hypothetical protein